MTGTIPSKGKLEAQVSQAVIRFEREFMGRGPLEARTYLIDDMVVVRLKGVLTVAEQRLAANGERGPQLVRQIRQELIDQGRPLLEKVLTDVLGVPIRGVHTDICATSDERVIVFSLAGRPAVRNQLTSPNHSHMISI